MSTWKTVWYYCPGCKTRLGRLVIRANATHKSYCGGVGKEVILRKLKVQPK